MAITKQKKGEVVTRINEAVKNAASVVFVHFKNLSVEDTNAMRRALRDSGVGYMVAKKTLIKHALADRGYNGEVPQLDGEIALAWSEGDPTLAARDIYEHGKKHKGALTIVGGIYEGAYQDATAMNAIATIPPLPVLRGMFVNVINSSIQGLVTALDKVRETKTA